MGLRNTFLAMLAKTSTPGYTAVATHFNASSDMIKTGGFAGNADGKQGIISFWIKPTTISNKRFFGQGDSGHDFQLGFISAALQIFGANALGGTVLDLRANASISTGVWTHVIASWDMATGSALLYINGVDQSNVIAANDDSIAYTKDSLFGWQIVGHSSPGMDTCIAEFYFNPKEFLDLSNPASVAKFYSGGKPVSLGTDGSTPTGTAPLMYLRQNGANILVNSGTGGDFDSTDGTVDDCASSPSD